VIDARKPGFNRQDPLRALGIRPPALTPARPDDGLADRLTARLDKRDWLLHCRARLEALLPPAIPRVAGMDPATFLQNHYIPLRPVILEGLVNHWPARTRWSLEHFRTLGNPEVEVQAARDTDPDFEMNSPTLKRIMPWHAFLDRLAETEATNDIYMTANNGSVNRKALSPLWDEIAGIPGYLAANRMGDGFLWVGPRGTITPWHHDLTQNFLLQLQGTKKVTLASPSETPRMQNHRHCFSRFGTRADLSGEPDAPRTFEAIIGPGDILFIPVGWWHHVEGLTQTIGMSFTNFVWPNDFADFYRSNRDL
jgi:hypothetical protein